MCVSSGSRGYNPLLRTAVGEVTTAATLLLSLFFRPADNSATAAVFFFPQLQEMLSFAPFPPLSRVWSAVTGAPASSLLPFSSPPDHCGRAAVVLFSLFIRLKALFASFPVNQPRRLRAGDASFFSSPLLIRLRTGLFSLSFFSRAA